MIKQDLEEIKQVVKEGTLEVLKSDEGRQVIKEGALEALRSEDGKNAIVEALKTPEAKDIFMDYFVEGFHDVVVPVIEKYDERITRLEQKIGVNI
ncbi:MAG: hypothetical protein ACD_20C00217G0002 [uncultured bacterium]|nr:MAG: hypothetical protein ACD_20C00217G0002 [uncultured bacterium]